MTNYNPLILEAAAGYLGEAEWPGAKTNPVIAGFFAASGNGDLADEVPWCAAFINAVMGQVGLQGTGKLNARSFLDWGVPVNVREVRPGDVVVFWRVKPEDWRGHVGIVVRFEGDRVIVRGGNQRKEGTGGAVTDASYPLSQVLGFRRAVKQDETGRPILRNGSKGAFVLLLQDQLSRLGYHIGKRDGVFGSLTREAVLAFQADNELDVDGVVGAQTWAALETAPQRPKRAVEVADLRQRGSTIVKNADTIDVTAGITAAAASIGVVTDAAKEAEGVLSVSTRIITDHWPTLLVVGALVGIVILSGRIRAARVRDAQSGAHTGR